MDFIHPKKKTVDFFFHWVMVPFKGVKPLSIWFEGSTEGRPSQRKVWSMKVIRLIAQDSRFLDLNSFSRLNSFIRLATSFRLPTIPVLLWKACRAHGSAHLGWDQQPSGVPTRIWKMSIDSQEGTHTCRSFDWKFLKWMHTPISIGKPFILCQQKLTSSNIG